MGSEKIAMLLCVVAYAGEARALIDFYRLKKDLRHKAFSVFKSSECWLIVSGPGKQNAASATTYLGALRSEFDDLDLWLNIGIAGHQTSEPGSLYRVNKITDLRTNKCEYPISLIQSKGICCAPILTVDEPESDFGQTALYDMEASAFFTSAKRFSTIEHIVVFKVVSDNMVKPASVEIVNTTAQLLRHHLSSIDAHIRMLQSKIKNLHDVSLIPLIEPLIDSISAKIKLTQTQQFQVRALINSLLVQGVASAQIKTLLSQSRSAKAVCMNLQHRLDLIKLTV